MFFLIFLFLALLIAFLFVVTNAVVVSNAGPERERLENRLEILEDRRQRVLSFEKEKRKALSDDIAHTRERLDAVRRHGCSLCSGRGILGSFWKSTCHICHGLGHTADIET